MLERLEMSADMCPTCHFFVCGVSNICDILIVITLTKVGGEKSRVFLGGPFTIQNL